MNKDRGWRNPWLVMLACLLLVSAAYNATLFTKIRENTRAANGTIEMAMSLIQSADSHLHEAIRTIEDGGEIVESLYALGEVRTRLNETQGLLWGVKGEFGRHSANNLSVYVLPETIRAFDAYLQYDVLAGWRQDGNTALNASREQVLTELRSMKQDLAQLSSLSHDSSYVTYDVRKFVGQWEDVMKQRIAEDPEAEIHQQIAWLYDK